ncbi:hypothetical protein BU24DRAFT_403604 [Aaosphaeria arxii CBS 175.79]|uniref:Fe2OG dioxygenase domain-containing protein n=1 Tax=Aaosphaeria arxii CBS 175.79 TaxID=1450172 RepID=A0A6A5Y4R3_9PLEO|nr:uncharacterized protein BU24DRAFT_403604 [Aaosphaeria arxii CBS 175.79]KAF2020498.1 hypothetical protein BU24DRAFT_403604 [Aaosphaeria arxii CBS 175.79]
MQGTSINSQEGSRSGVDPREQFRIQQMPPNFYYVPNFITPEEEASLLQKIPAHRWVTLSHRRLQAHPSTLTKNNTLLGAPLPPYLVQPVVDRFKMLGIFDHTPHKEPNHVLINEYKRGEGIMPHEDGSAYADVVATISLGGSICLEITPKAVGSEGEPRESATISNTPAQKGPTEHLNEEHMNEALVDESKSQGPASQYRLPTRILQEPRSLLITTSSAYVDLLHGIASIEVDENLNKDTVANWDILGDSSVFEDAGGRNERATRISLTYRDVLKVSSAANKVLGGLGRR